MVAPCFLVMGTMPCPATYTGRWAPEDKDLYTPADLLSHTALTFLSKQAEARSICRPPLYKVRGKKNSDKNIKIKNRQ